MTTMPAGLLRLRSMTMWEKKHKDWKLAICWSKNVHSKKSRDKGHQLFIDGKE